ncbi:MAG: condensation domain-containing protein [Aliidongia sp.]
MAAAQDGPVPLSYSQERMWLIQSLDPENTAYNMAAGMRISGALAVDALSQALDILHQRHEILRSTISWPTISRCRRSSPGRDPRSRLSICPIVARRRSDWPRRWASTPFDLAIGPVVRTTLFRPAASEHLLVMVLHHIAGDQWSIGVLGRELAQLYNGLRPRRSGGARAAFDQLSRLCALAADPAPSRRNSSVSSPIGDNSWPTCGLGAADRSTSGAAARLAGHVLSGADPRPADRPDGAAGPSGRLHAIHDHAGRLRHAALSDHRSGRHTDRRAGGKSHRKPPPKALSVPSSTRWCCGVDLSGNPTFGDLLLRVRATALDALAQQDVSFDRLVQDIRQRRDSNRAPLAQVLLNVTNAPMHGIDLRRSRLEAGARSIAAERNSS